MVSEDRPQRSSAADHGMPLRQAIERYSDTQMWHELLALKSIVSGRRVIVRSISLDEGLEHYYARADNAFKDRTTKGKEYDSLRRQLIEEFWDKFRSGKLIAEGYCIPRSPSDLRERVPPDMLHDGAEVGWDEIIPPKNNNYGSEILALIIGSSGYF